MISVTKVVPWGERALKRSLFTIFLLLLVFISCLLIVQPHFCTIILNVNSNKSCQEMWRHLHRTLSVLLQQIRFCLVIPIVTRTHERSFVPVVPVLHQTYHKNLIISKYFSEPAPNCWPLYVTLTGREARHWSNNVPFLREPEKLIIFWMYMSYV